MNSAEEFSKAMFGEEFKTKVPIETVNANSSFIGVGLRFLLFLIFLIVRTKTHCNVYS